MDGNAGEDGRNDLGCKRPREDKELIVAEDGGLEAVLRSEKRTCAMGG